MNKTTLTIRFLFLSGCFLMAAPAIMQVRAAINPTARNTLFQTECLTKFTKGDFRYLLKDANPLMLKSLADDPELRKQQIKSIRELLAITCQSLKEGFTNDYAVGQELKNLEIEQTALAFDREINKVKGSMPPLAGINKQLVEQFYAVQGNQSDFENYLKVKIQIATENGQMTKDLDTDQIEQVKDFFAKTRIYYAQAQKKPAQLSEDFWGKLALQINLQKAQFLSQLYTQKVIAEKTKVTDAEIQSFIAEHPEFDRKAQKAKALKILQFAKAGKNFILLAKQYSEDPGSKDTGGLYKNVTEGQFVKTFEDAAFSLKAGQIYPQVVESEFGYHIIKLEKKSITKDKNGKVKRTYDVRHILISTMVKDPDNAMNAPIPVNEYVKNKLEEAKQIKILDEIVANNRIEIPEDFEVSGVSDEQ